MLGLMLFDFFTKNTNHRITGTIRGPRTKEFEKFNNQIVVLDATSNLKKQLHKLLNARQYDYVINCIGVIKPYCNTTNITDIKNAVLVNSIFPYELNEYLNEISQETKIIQIATDCVFDGKKGEYLETDLHNPTDVYGKTKSLGEVNDINFLNIRCSIVGPEKYHKISLLEWFLSQPKTTKIDGYDHHRWNGVTTLQFAEFCNEIISNNLFNLFRKKNHCIHYIKNETVTKYELLEIFKCVYNTDHFINKLSGSTGEHVYRDLSTLFPSGPLKKMEHAISELKQYLKNNHSFNS